MDPLWFMFGKYVLNVCEFKYQKYIIFIGLCTLVHFKIYNISPPFYACVRQYCSLMGQSIMLDLLFLCTCNIFSFWLLSIHIEHSINLSLLYLKKKKKVVK